MTTEPTFFETVAEVQKLVDDANAEVVPEMVEHLQEAYNTGHLIRIDHDEAAAWQKANPSFGTPMSLDVLNEEAYER